MSSGDCRTSVLLVEDNAGDAFLVNEFLDPEGAERYWLSTSGRLAAALAYLGGQAVDCVLLDLSLPDADQLEGLAALREAFPLTPVVVLTGLRDSWLGEEALRLGAQDFLVKRDLTSDGLTRSIRYAIERHRQRLELEQAYLRLSAEADELHRATEQFESAFKGAPIGMALAGLDGTFLKVNKALCDMLDHSEAELLGRSLVAVGHPDERHQLQRALADLASGGAASVRAEHRLVAGTGRVVWALLSVAPVHGLSGSAAYLVCQGQDITERKHLEERLSHEALHDALTGLPNRLLLQARIGQADPVPDRVGSLAVLYVDIDDLKAVNDSRGHGAGDQLIVAVASRLRDSVRPSDAVARIGGDEFVVLAEGFPEPAEAIALAHRIQDYVAVPLQLVGGEIVPSISVGVALAGHRDRRLADVLGEADTAMYRAKQQGKNRVVAFEATEAATPAASA